MTSVWVTYATQSLKRSKHKLCNKWQKFYIFLRHCIHPIVGRLVCQTTFFQTLPRFYILNKNAISRLDVLECAFMTRERTFCCKIKLWISLKHHFYDYYATVKQFQEIKVVVCHVLTFLFSSSSVMWAQTLIRILLL